MGKKILAKKCVLENPNMDYEFNPTKQPSHITMGYNSAKLHSNKVVAIANKLVMWEKIR